jgi:hypothetical protein
VIETAMISMSAPFPEPIWKRADLIKRRAERDEAISRHAAVRWFQADNAAK